MKNKEMQCESRMISFNHLYANQVIFQSMLNRTRNVSMTLPCDSPQDVLYHMGCLTIELGEVMQADKRWKVWKEQGRELNDQEKAEKIDEMSDVMLFLMNMYIYSGLSATDIMDAVKDKQVRNFQMLQDLMKEGE